MERVVDSVRREIPKMSRTWGCSLNLGEQGREEHGELGAEPERPAFRRQRCVFIYGLSPVGRGILVHIVRVV